MLNKLGEELKEARLSMDVSLQQMSTKTRIDIKFLEAIENGNFSFLPELYVKAFLKEYCAFVGLDPALILKKYELAKQGKSFEEPAAPAPAPPPAIEPTPEIKKEEPKQTTRYNPPLPTFDAVQHEPASESSSSASGRQRILLASVIGGTIIVIAAVYFIFFNNSSEIIVPEKSYEEVVEQQDNNFYEDEADTSGAGSAADSALASTSAADSMKLDIRATDTSWVKILLDDTKSDEFILFPRSRKTITAAKNYKITFGKSYAVKLELNGKPLDYKPGKTKVAHVLIDSTGITNLQQAPRFE